LIADGGLDIVLAKREEKRLREEKVQEGEGGEGGGQSGE
jgi:hypothetical protein